MEGYKGVTSARRLDISRGTVTLGRENKSLVINRMTQLQLLNNAEMLWCEE